VLLGLMMVGGALAADWDMHSDSWVATDALGRKLPGYKECGPPRHDRFVGIFYFTWHQPGPGPYDITKILAENPENPKWGPVNAFHHWGQPEMGYYLSEDPYVIRKHLMMLSEAGVDTLILDVTNAWTYTSTYMKLCEIMTQLRKEGMHTPQMLFIAHSAEAKTVQKLYDEFYSKNLYPDLWFRWEGKPLVLANPSELSDTLKGFFTVRYSWFDHDPNGWFGDGHDRWTWLDPWVQQAGWHVKGVPEEVSVGIATHPIANLGRSNHNHIQPPHDKYDMTTTAGNGYYFADEWDRALELDPKFVFVTGWNEWIAQRFVGPSQSVAGNPRKKDGSWFVDQYDQEYSRDAEPMTAGHTDNYYYQLISYIRRYKGVRPPEKASGAKTISIDGSFGDWAGVRPEFRDPIGDTLHRDYKGWGDTHYTNTTGRNDIIRARVAYDKRNVYFYVETAAPLTSYKDHNWMLLFIDIDRSASTGWQGYDYVVNYPVVSATATTLKKSTGGWNWKTVSNVSYKARGNAMEISIPRAALGLAGKPVAFDFHWADNIQKPADIIEFSVSGDSAPDRRFNYRYEQ
jgi:hypothetical protein